MDMLDILKQIHSYHSLQHRVTVEVSRNIPLGTPNDTTLGYMDN